MDGLLESSDVFLCGIYQVGDRLLQALDLANHACDILDVTPRGKVLEAARNPLDGHKELAGAWDKASCNRGDPLDEPIEDLGALHGNLLDHLAELVKALL